MDVSEVWACRPARYPTAGLPELPATTPFALLHGDGRWVILAEDPLVRLDTARLPDLRFRRVGPTPPIRPDVLGFVGYGYPDGRRAPLRPAREPLALPDLRLVLYARIRIWDRTRGLLYEGRREAPRTAAAGPSLLRPGTFRARRIWDSETRASYRHKVKRIRDEIVAGSVYQVDLTRQEAWAYEGDLLEFAARLAAADPAPCSALIAEPDFVIIGASPESFLRLRARRLTTRPIKGTAPRGADAARDRAEAAWLRSSPKNRSELAMIVDLMRNDLTRVCEIPSVRVTTFPRLDRHARVMHLSAVIAGRLRRPISLPDLLEGVFPGGSVTGCPKLAAVDLIAELEEAARGPYTGAIGWLSSDLSQLDLGMAIRTVWAGAHELRLGVGGGVVWDSDPDDEYRETQHKAASVVHCLG
jgi:para-aminobenzoate synthetase component 1